MSDLQQPLSEIEKAELLHACQAVLNHKGVDLLRRALYQLDVLAAQSASPESRESLDKMAPVHRANNRRTGLEG